MKENSPLWACSNDAQLVAFHSGCTAGVRVSQRPWSCAQGVSRGAAAAAAPRGRVLLFQRPCCGQCFLPPSVLRAGGAGAGGPGLHHPVCAAACRRGRRRRGAVAHWERPACSWCGELCACPVNGAHARHHTESGAQLPVAVAVNGVRLIEPGHACNKD